MLQFVLVQSKAWMITWDSVSYFTVLKRLKVRLELVSSKNITSSLAWDSPHHSWGNGNNHQPMPVSQTMFSLPAEVFFSPTIAVLKKVCSIPFIYQQCSEPTVIWQSVKRIRKPSTFYNRRFEPPKTSQGGLWMPHPWRHSRPGWMWLWAAWSDGWWPFT